MQENQEEFQVTINVVVEKRGPGGYQGERLSTNETIFLKLTSFTEIAAVLGQFHDLAQTIRKDES